MARFEVPNKVNLPDNWADIIVEKLKKTKAFVSLLFGARIANGLEILDVQSKL